MQVDNLLLACVWTAEAAVNYSVWFWQKTTPGSYRYAHQNFCFTTYFVPSGDAGVSLPPRLCTRLTTWRQVSSASLTSMHVGNCALPVRLSSLLHAPCLLPSAAVPSRQLQRLIGVEQFGHCHRCQFSAASRLKTDVFARPYDRCD